MKKIIFILFILTINNSIVAEKSSDFFSKSEEILPANQVFKVDVKDNKNNLQINWAIQNGYYLYLNSIKVKRFGNELEYKILDIDLYDHSDEFFGETKIIRNKLKISLKNNDANTKPNIEIFYQGCSDKGFCYPLQNYKI